MTDDWTCWWGTPLLLKDNAAGNHWLEITLQGTACNRDAVGAAITWSAMERVWNECCQRIVTQNIAGSMCRPDQLRPHTGS